MELIFNLETMKIALLSNVNMDMVVKNLSGNYEMFETSGYGEWVQSLLGRSIYSFNPQIIFVILDGEEFFRNIGELNKSENEVNIHMRYIEDAVKSNPNIIFFISDIDIPCKKIAPLKNYKVEYILENYWYKKLIELSDKYSNFYIFDIKKLIADFGRESFYSPKLWYLGGIKYSFNAQKLIEKEIRKIISSVKESRKKCMVFDLDNTLWGGIVGETGTENISLSDFKEGAIYKDFQKRIKEIKDTGVILAIVSKNNLQDVKDVFNNNSNMVLKESDFASIRVNWNSKAQNIREIADELNIGLDSLAFIDDNPVEREEISSLLPQVIVPEFPSDISKLEKFATELYSKYFIKLKVLDEDSKKTEMYRQNADRRKSKKDSGSLGEFLRNLNTVVRIWRAKPQDISRIAELTQKTNQFNLTTKRYTESDINRLLTDKSYEVYISSVEDKFGDNGKVIVAIIKKDKKKAYVDTFLMSCRVMGRNIEFEVLRLLENILLSDGYDTMFGEYVYSKKNKPVEEFYEKMNYKLIEDTGGIKKYKKDLKKDLNNLKVNSFSKLILM